MNDLIMCTKYVRTSQSAKNRGIEFNLPFTSFKNIMRAKKCQYTGVILTEPKMNNPRPTDVTVERVDNKKGYVKGNVIAVCREANQIKGTWETNDSYSKLKQIISSYEKIMKRMNKDE